MNRIRPPRFRRLAMVACASLAAVTMAACNSVTGSGGDDNAGDSKKPIVIGGTLGLTGAYSGPSAGYLAAWKYWADKVNSSGGLLGRQVKLRILDDESTPSTAQQLYQRLVNQDKVDLVLAPYTTAVGGAVVPIVGNAKKVLWDAGFVSQQLHSKSKWLVSSWPYQEPEYSLPFFSYLKTLPADKKPKTLAVVTAQNPFTTVARDGYDGKGGVLRYAADNGIKVVFKQSYDESASDLSGLIQQAKAKKPDAFVALSLPDDASLIAKTMARTGFSPDYYCSCGSQVTTLPNWKDLGKPGERVFGTTTAWPQGGDADLKAFAKSIDTKLKYPYLPAYVAVGYSIMQVLEQDVKQVGSLDQAKLRANLTGKSFDTVEGKLTYNADGTVQFGALLVQFQKGTNQVIWPADRATGKALAPYQP